jgi:hypothetical protein
MDENTEDRTTLDYDVASEFAGHKPNKGVPIEEAVKDIFRLVKEKSMQVAVKGVFIQFDTIGQLKERLKTAAIEGVTVRVHDENIGG